jgi:hypothetical protein
MRHGMQRRRWWKRVIMPLSYARRRICKNIFPEIFGWLHRRFMEINNTQMCL